MEVVLVAEDDPEISTLMALTLRMEGYEVVQAHDGMEALKYTAERSPDLILLDVMMPMMSGYEVAAKLQADPATQSLPIIFVTAKHEMEDRVHGLGMAVDYICKPFAVPELLARVRAALRMRKLQEELRVTNEQLSRLAVTDELTGLCNRRGFDAELQDELVRARRFKYPIAVAMFDLDHFKQVNDTWGHPQGDIVLQAFAKVLQKSSRRVDKVARVGGEEFLALLPTTDEDGAATFAEKVRTSTEELSIPCSGTDGKPCPPLSVTVSAGVAVVETISESELDNATLMDALIKEADACLYRAKTSGRNRVVVQSIKDLSEVSHSNGPVASKFAASRNMPSRAPEADPAESV